MRVVCCTMYSPAYKELAAICLPNLSKYCERHGYGMHIIHVEDQKWEFKKHEEFKELAETWKADVLFYCDIDTLITNHGIKIESFLDDENSYYVTKDFNELNNGVLILKCDDHGKWVNDFILGGKKIQGHENEQNTLNYYLEELAWVKICSHPSFNSYDYSCYPECKELIGDEYAGDWKPGNFVIHFPGLGLKDRVELMKEYSQKIIE